MKRFKETNEGLYDSTRKEKLAHDLALISEAGDDMCAVPLEKLKSKVLRTRHKKMCGTPQKTKKSIWSKAAQKAAGSHKLYNSPVKGFGGWYDIEEGPADNLAILIQDIASKMIRAVKKNDSRMLKGLYKNLGQIIK